MMNIPVDYRGVYKSSSSNVFWLLWYADGNTVTDLATPAVLDARSRWRARARSRFARLVALPSGADDTVVAAELVLRLAVALASEEWRAATGDWSHRPVRLHALRHALARARADLRRLRRLAAELP